MSKQNELDEILQKMFNNTRPTIALPKAKQQLSKLISEIIGEDADDSGADTNRMMLHIQGGNIVRKIQRQKAKEKGFIL